MGAGRARPQLCAAALASALLRPSPPEAVGPYAPATPLLQPVPPPGWLVSSSVCTIEMRAETWDSSGGFGAVASLVPLQSLTRMLRAEMGSA